MEFNKANVSVAVAAKALGMDPQTVRLLLRQGLVTWGCAYKRTPQSRQFSYLISPKRFYEETGVLLGGAGNDC